MEDKRYKEAGNKKNSTKSDGEVNSKIIIIIYLNTTP
jgi:hypothetical protein